jgi:hypothetical protein
MLYTNFYLITNFKQPRNSNTLLKINQFDFWSLLWRSNNDKPPPPIEFGLKKTYSSIPFLKSEAHLYLPIPFIVFNLSLPNTL